MLSIMIASMLSFTAWGEPVESDLPFQSIRMAIEQGNYAEAEASLNKLVRWDPENPEIHHLLGRIYELRLDFDRSTAHYERESALRRHSDVELLKRVATLNARLRRYKRARAWLQRALILRPDDREALTDLKNLSLKRSVHFIGSSGGWETDYTRSNYEIGSFVGWFNWLDLYASHSRMDRVFYRRSSFSFDAYLFPSHRTYVRVGGRLKRYTYPAELNPSPDHNSYDQLPDLQFEVGHYYSGENNFYVELEYFHPNFYWNKDLRTDNIKVSAGIRNWIVRPFYVKSYLAFLRDPQPSSFITDSATNRIVSFEYNSHLLLGGALGYDAGNLSMEIKYLPDRDMDRTIDYSLFAKMRYMKRGFGLQYDFLYDRYSQSDFRGFSASRVNVVTFIVDRWDFFQVRVGAKVLDKESTEINPFIYMRIKTGF